MAKAYTVVWASALALAITMAGCRPGVSPIIAEAATANTQGTPWLNQMIQQMQEDETANPPAKIYRYNYQEKEVYYVTGRCCDIPGKVYNMYGNIICEPDGGITGKGDGRCPDFFEQRKDETLIWEDKREQN